MKIVLKEDVERGHKVAICDIKKTRKSQSRREPSWDIEEGMDASEFEMIYATTMQKDIFASRFDSSKGTKPRRK